MNMKRAAVFALAMFLALPLVGARADWRVGFSFGGPTHRVYPRVYVGVGPVFVRPAPVYYYAPAPVYVTPAPVYLQPVPVAQPVYQVPVATQPVQQYLPAQPVPIQPGQQ